MLHLTPVQYPKLIKRSIYIKNIDGNEIIFNFMDKKCRIFYGKKIFIIVENKGFYGKYYVRETIDKGIEHYLFILNTLDATDKTNLAKLKNKQIDIFETFVVSDDSQAVTYQDVIERLTDEQEDAIVDINKINRNGVPGLISGFDSLKLKNLNYNFKFLEPIIINNTSTKPIVTFNLESNKINYFKLFLFNETDDNDKGSIICLEFYFSSNNEYFYIKNNSHFKQKYNLSNEILKNLTKNNEVNNYVLKLKKRVYKTGNISISVVINLENNGSERLSGWFSCNSPKDLWNSNNADDYVEQIIKLNGNNSIVINSSLLFVDSFGEQKTITLGDVPTKSIPLGKETSTSDTIKVNIKDLSVGFYKINDPLALVGGPCDDNDSSKESGVNKITLGNWNSADIIKFNQNQVLYLTDTGEIFIGKSLGDNKYEWHRLSTFGHTHVTDDIDDSGNKDKKFVSIEQINTWNNATDKINNISWITTEEDLTSEQENQNRTDYGKRPNAVKLFPYGDGGENDENKYGNPILYANIDEKNKYVPLSIGALTVESKKVKNCWKNCEENQNEGGTLIKQSTIDALGRLGMGIRVPDNLITQYPTQVYREQYVLIDNEILLYQSNEENKRFFDLVKRKSEYEGDGENKRLKTLSIGQNSINFGFDNAIATNDSILFGVGLTINKNIPQIILGKYNEAIDHTECKFIVGIGTGITDRKNAFWFSSSGIKNIFHINGNIKLDNFEEGLILVNGSDPIKNDFVHALDVTRLNRRLDRLASVLITITKYEDLTSGKLTYTYEQDKPLENLPLKAILKNVTTTSGAFDDSKYAIFLTDTLNGRIGSEHNIKLLNEYIDGSFVLYAECVYKNYLTILDISNKNNYKGKKFKLSDFYDFNNASFTVEIDNNATVDNSKIFNVVHSNIAIPLEIA